MRFTGVACTTSGRSDTRWLPALVEAITLGPAVLYRRRVIGIRPRTMRFEPHPRVDLSRPLPSGGSQRAPVVYCCTRASACGLLHVVLVLLMPTAPTPVIVFQRDNARRRSSRYLDSCFHEYHLYRGRPYTGGYVIPSVYVLCRTVFFFFLTRI